SASGPGPAAVSSATAPVAAVAAASSTRLRDGSCDASPSGAAATPVHASSRPATHPATRVAPSETILAMSILLDGAIDTGIRMKVRSERCVPGRGSRQPAPCGPLPTSRSFPPGRERVPTGLADPLRRHGERPQQVDREVRGVVLLGDRELHAAQPGVALAGTDRQMGMGARDVDGAVLLGVEARTVQPAAEEACQLVAGLG